MGTGRRARPREDDLREHARPERADFARTLEQLKDAFGPHVVATEIPLGAEPDVQGVVDLVDMKAFVEDSAERGAWSEIPIPQEIQERAQEYREKLMDEVSEVSDSLMERYLEGDSISHQEIVDALKEGTNHGKIFPVVCGVATRNLGTTRLLDAIVEDLPSPVKHGALQVGEVELRPTEDGELFAYVFKTRADPFAGRINLLRVYQGVLRADSHVLNTRAHTKERIGQLLLFKGKDVGHVQEFGPGDIGAVAKLKETHAGDWLAARDEPIDMPALTLPAAVMAFAVEPKSRGDEDKVLTSLRRLQEEDPTLDLHRDQQTGEQIVAGLSQVHVEVIVDRLRDRFGVEVTLKPPRVPYQETIRSHARAHGRHKKQSGGRGQFGDCVIEIEPLGDGEGFEFVDRIKGGVIPSSFIPAVEKGVREAMDSGVLAGYPVKGVRVTLVDGSYHSVDSSEIAFKLAGLHAMKQALEEAEPVLLEPIMLVTLSVPEESVGEVIGDLNSRRGHPHGMQPVGALTEIKAEVPMAEVLHICPRPQIDHGGAGRLHARVPALPGGSRADRPAGRAGILRRRGAGGPLSNAGDRAHSRGKRSAHGSSCTRAALITQEISLYQPAVTTSSMICASVKRSARALHSPSGMLAESCSSSEGVRSRMSCSPQQSSSAGPWTIALSCSSVNPSGRP